MVVSHTPTCDRCGEYQQRILALEAELDQARAKIEDLQEQLAVAKTDSSTSHKPPSSDIVKPPKNPTTDGSPRAPGGQPGHPHHQRQPFPPELLTGRFDHAHSCCPDCGGPVHTCALPARIVQQIDIPQIPHAIEEHRSFESWCPQCQKHYIAPLPPLIDHGGLFGPYLRTLVAYLKGICHASFSTIRKYFRDVLQIKISRGYLAKVIRQVSEALQEPYDELLAQLKNAPVVNTDETGHPHAGKNWWTWVFRAELYTVFRVDPHRSADVLFEVLGKKFRGVLGCDQFSAYHRYMRTCDVRVQWCMAHLIREVKFLTTLPGVAAKAYGNRLRDALRELFAVIHQHETLSESVFKQKLQEARKRILEAGTQDVPDNKYCENIAERLRVHGEGYFVFITTPGVGPTNNAAEQAIRFVIIDRYITQGTRSVTGQRWSERIWTIVATCVQQGRSVHDFLQGCITAHLQRTAKPSLVPTATPGG
jgi:transposase